MDDIYRKDQCKCGLRNVNMDYWWPFMSSRTMCMHASIQSVYIYLNTIMHIWSGITRGLNETLYCPHDESRFCLHSSDDYLPVWHKTWRGDSTHRPKTYSMNCSNLQLSLMFVEATLNTFIYSQNTVHLVCLFHFPSVFMNIHFIYQL